MPLYELQKPFPQPDSSHYRRINFFDRVTCQFHLPRKLAGRFRHVRRAVSYRLFSNSFFLQQFINRRIKLIYKLIYHTKASRKEEIYYKYILPKKSLEEVTEDVEKWAVQKSNEIELLEKNEAYRKEFLQNLAHEFKTPIFAIQGYIDTLLDGAMEKPDIRKNFLKIPQKM